MAKAKKGKSAGGGGPKEMLLVASKVKAMIKDAGCNTAGDALDGLNGYVGWLVMQAARRANSGGDAPSMALADIVRGIEIVLAVATARTEDIATPEGVIS